MKRTAMIKVSINNRLEDFEADTSVLKALEKMGYASDAMLGVAINKVFVSKDQWAEKSLKNNDQVDILNPVSGG